MTKRFELIKNFIEIIKLPNKKFNYNYKIKKGYLNELDIFLHHKITSFIKKNYSKDNIISEENYKNNISLKKNNYSWVIDPLCGTTNFTHSIPFFSTSISLNYNNKCIFSFIKDWQNKELFYSFKGKSYLGNETINVSNKKKLSNSIVFLNCNQSDHKNIDNNLVKLINALKPPVTRRIHILESANLELAYIACGRADAYINFQDNIWDINAGSLLIKNAGGETKFINKKEKTKNIGIIASNKNIFKKINTIVKTLI